MKGEIDLNKLLKGIKAQHNPGDYVFCTVADLNKINIDEIQLLFKESEGISLILKKEYADTLNLKYSFTAAWITLAIHSSLEAVGFTAAFSNALAKANISCNVVAAYYHDHLFVK
ncbi:ACT domain-containing protein [Lacihabitans sp. LS3-19]|uniref:ACT domain-containing protein n=1 Tax=Lacihabitans sp. LS3-19 TaxID=2487335 RepID=UPI0020CF5D2E|nr:ACT domain-containing protein [Lacihabitans sp. LS3-19]MCP9768462.1 ACT domain-containing protein [Lacihabitans sp. LS3-19]